MTGRSPLGEEAIAHALNFAPNQKLPRYVVGHYEFCQSGSAVLRAVSV
jgi:hypothetical protein